MYILIIFHDQNCKHFNCMWFYDTIKQLIDDTKNVVKYSDVNKKTRTYKTAKSFFRIFIYLPITEDNYGNVLTLEEGDSLEIMIKLDYVDQQAVTNEYIGEVPKHL